MYSQERIYQAQLKMLTSFQPAHIANSTRLINTEIEKAKKRLGQALSRKLKQGRKEKENKDVPGESGEGKRQDRGMHTAYGKGIYHKRSTLSKLGWLWWAGRLVWGKLAMNSGVVPRLMGLVGLTLALIGSPESFPEDTNDWAKIDCSPNQVNNAWAHRYGRCKLGDEQEEERHAALTAPVSPLSSLEVPVVATYVHVSICFEEATCVIFDYTPIDLCTDGKPGEVRKVRPRGVKTSVASEAEGFCEHCDASVDGRKQTNGRQESPSASGIGLDIVQVPGVVLAFFEGVRSGVSTSIRKLAGEFPHRPIRIEIGWSSSHCRWNKLTKTAGGTGSQANLLLGSTSSRSSASCRYGQCAELCLFGSRMHLTLGKNNAHSGLYG